MKLDLSSIKENIERRRSDNEIVQLYSIVIDQLNIIKLGIGFSKHPIKIRDEVNDAVHSSILGLIDEGIKDCEAMIDFHIGWRKAHPQGANVSIDSSKVKTEVPNTKLTFKITK